MRKGDKIRFLDAVGGGTRACSNISATVDDAW